MTDDEHIQRGEFYEDCRYHPMLCISGATDDDDELVGVSLVDGMTGACSEQHCGVVRMTVDEAIERKVHWNAFAAERGLPNPFPRDGWPPNEVG